jgi:protein-S-isoprenylcysteine O-methyltransferase Ste14
MNRHLTGWVYVALQGVLLGALILLPGRDDWATPSWLRGAGYGFILAGLAVIAIASLRLGPALTPTPVPTSRGVLATTGLYRWVRHPIYTGVLTIVAGLTVRSGSLVHLAVAVTTVVFFTVKAKWEEARLAERYVDYDDYAARTPRFVPRPWRHSAVG